MTFSLAGRCERTGAVGAVIASASMAVAARCVAVRAGVGAVCSQSTTDPRLRGQLLDAMASGLAAAGAIAAVVGRAPDITYRQLAAVDVAGGSACYSGDLALGEATHVRATGAAAAGNLLADRGVPAAMLAAFTGRPGDSLGDRLICRPAGRPGRGRRGLPGAFGRAADRGVGALAGHRPAGRLARRSGRAARTALAALAAAGGFLPRSGVAACRDRGLIRGVSRWCWRGINGKYCSMSIAISEEHRALAQTVARFLADHQSRAAARRLLEAEADTLPAFWGELGSLGLLGLHVPEELGGSGFGLSRNAGRSRADGPVPGAGAVRPDRHH